MTFEMWFFILGALLITVALLASSVKALPLTETMIYLSAGLVPGGALAPHSCIQSVATPRVQDARSAPAKRVMILDAGVATDYSLLGWRWSSKARLIVGSPSIRVGLEAPITRCICAILRNQLSGNSPHLQNRVFSPRAVFGRFHQPFKLSSCRGLFQIAADFSRAPSGTTPVSR